VLQSAMKTEQVKHTSISTGFVEEIEI
jgi:hypothetical protein